MEEIIENYKRNGYQVADSNYRKGVSMVNLKSKKVVLLDPKGRIEEGSFKSYSCYFNKRKES